MDDAAYEAQKARIEQFARYWIERLGLRWWRIDLKWDRGDNLPSADPAISEEWSGYAATDTAWQYLRAQVTFAVGAFTELDDEDAERSVLHELVHVLVEELRPEELTWEWQRHNERCVSMLTSAFLWTRGT